MNILRKSVDSILSSIKSNIEALHAHAEAEKIRGEKKQAKADLLLKAYDAHTEERTRATKVAHKLSELIS